MSIDKQIEEIQQQIWALEEKKKELLSSATTIWLIDRDELIEVKAIEGEPEDDCRVFIDENNYLHFLGDDCWLSKEAAIEYRVKHLEDCIIVARRMLETREKKLREFKNKYGVR